MQTFSPKYPCFNQRFHILSSLSYTLVQLNIFFLVITSIIVSQLGSPQSDRKHSHILWKDLILITFSLSFYPFLALEKSCEEIDTLKGAHILLLHVSTYHVTGLSSCNYFNFFPLFSWISYEVIFSSQFYKVFHMWYLVSFMMQIKVCENAACK